MHPLGGNLHPFEFFRGGFFHPFTSSRGGRAAPHPRFCCIPPQLYIRARGRGAVLHPLASWLWEGAVQAASPLFMGGPSTFQLSVAGGGVESSTFCTFGCRGGGQAAPHVPVAGGRDPGSSWHIPGAPGPLCTLALGRGCVCCHLASLHGEGGGRGRSAPLHGGGVGAGGFV